MTRQPATLPAPSGGSAPRVGRPILGTWVDALTYGEAASLVTEWAGRGEHRYVCVATVHTVMEGRDHPDFGAVVNGAALVTSDGMPLVWGLRLLGVPAAERVYGPDLTRAICARATREGIPVGFYGGSRRALIGMTTALRRQFPSLRIAYAFSPPFRDLTPSEEADVLHAIGRSGVRILFVGLGCPKQEVWMARHHSQVAAVLVGVGAAFDFIAGVKRQAPRVVQRVGLEWLFRLIVEPRRLWRRYLYHNPRFLASFGRQLLDQRGVFPSGRARLNVLSGDSRKEP